MKEDIKNGLNYLIPERWFNFMINLGGNCSTKLIPQSLASNHNLILPLLNSVRFDHTCTTTSI